VNRSRSLLLLCLALVCSSPGRAQVSEATPRRLVILKVDGLGADLLESARKKIDPRSGKSQLPWIAHVFAENGAIFENFYTRGISLSAPSWSMLDTGRHTVIRGNVEYDRYTGQIYDYLNFFPFYIGYARGRQVDMPGVEVLDRAGIPLLIDRFSYPQILQSFQLFQRGVRWTTLESALKRRFSAEAIVSRVESGDAPSYDAVLSTETENELERNLLKPEILYLDFFLGDIDHTGHATNQPEALLSDLRSLDSLTGRIWTTIQKSPRARQTIFVMVSDHGMNNAPGVLSQTYSLPDLLNSPEGGSHHVITNRHPMSDFKIRGLDPLVRRVISPSSTSFYLAGQTKYATAWLDLDGNERAAIHLRNSDLNKLHILLLALSRSDLTAVARRAAASGITEIVDRHRASWAATVAALDEELRALDQAMKARKATLDNLPKADSRSDQRASGQDKERLRLRKELDDWQNERRAYSEYLEHLRKLLAFEADSHRAFKGKVSNLIPEMSLGDNNSAFDLQHYVVGPAAAGLVVSPTGRLNQERSFRFVDYLELLPRQRVQNNPQKELSPRPIDFLALTLPPSPVQQAFWLYGDAAHQLMILRDREGRLSVHPVKSVIENPSGAATWTPVPWQEALPLALFEDPQLRLPAGASRAEWLSDWHTEKEWLDATHRCRYSNAVIGITEELSPVEDNVPGPPGANPILLRYERRRRQLVQADFHAFAADHWNFNVRFPNPGGNHGSFLRISTHSVWMMAGEGVPAGRIDTPYDSLDFASTLLHLAGRPAPLPDRIVSLTPPLTAPSGK
jgi:hypothetical protein